MNQAVRGCFLLLGLVSAPVSVSAQHWPGACHDCCQTCFQPAPLCHCVTARPVVKTHLQKQQFITYRDVVETHVRQEACVETVPVTAYQPVTETVWVPRQITRHVPTTVLQQQVRHRTVPYQVTRRVPQVATRLVPVQTIHHEPVVTPFSTPPANCAAPPAPVVPAPSYAPAPAPTTREAPPPPSAQGLSPAAAFETPAIDVPIPRTASQPFAAQYDDWAPIPARTQVEQAREPSEARPARQSQFVPAPSAATVWNTRGVYR